MSNTIIAALIAFTGTLIGSLIGFQIARRTIKDQFFYAAAAKLKQSFVDILRLLREPPDRFEVKEDSTIDAMDNSFWEHERAIFEFRYALPERKRARLDTAWNNYRGDGTGHSKLKDKYSYKANWQEDALKDIEAILKLTDK